MSHVTITTTVSHPNSTGQPQVDANRQNNIITRQDNLIDPPRTDSSNITSEVANNKHNVNTNVPYVPRNEDLNIHSHQSNKDSHNFAAPILTNYDVNQPHDLHRTNDVNQPHDLHRTNIVNQPHDLHKTNDVYRINDVHRTNDVLIGKPVHDVETDINRKDNWTTPDLNSSKGNKDDYKVKDDHSHHSHHDKHAIHDVNKPIVTPNFISNDNTHGTTHTHHDVSTHHVKTNPNVILDDQHHAFDANNRNITYDTNPTFANDIGTTGLLGNNLGNNLGGRLAPTGVNVNADWTGHVPSDPLHPKESDTKHVINEKKL